MAEDENTRDGIGMIASQMLATDIALALLFEKVEAIAPGTTKAVSDEMLSLADRDGAGLPERPIALRRLVKIISEGW